MPNRILRDWTDSLRFDGISAEAERLFVRIIMKADDFGRYHAESRLLKAGCFPLLDNLRTNDLDRWLDELSTRQLILRYEVRNRTYLAIINYGQRLKQSRAKFPQLDGESEEWMPISSDFREVPGSSGKFPSESETYSDAESDLEEEAESETNAEGVQGKLASSPPAAPPKRRLKAEPVNDEFLTDMQQRYPYADVSREWVKCSTWAEQKRITPSRPRFVNWLNRIEPPADVKTSPNGNQPGLQLGWGRDHQQQKGNQ